MTQDRKPETTEQEKCPYCGSAVVVVPTTPNIRRVDCTGCKWSSRRTAKPEPIDRLWRMSKSEIIQTARERQAEIDQLQAACQRYLRALNEVDLRVDKKGSINHEDWSFIRNHYEVL